MKKKNPMVCCIQKTHLTGKDTERLKIKGWRKIYQANGQQKKAAVAIAKTWNQPKCPLMIDWNGKMWHIYTMEYYAAIKNDEFVSFVGTWMNLKNIILSKMTQEQKMKYHIFSLIGR